jgi:hypothetical protein
MDKMEEGTNTLGRLNKQEDGDSTKLSGLMDSSMD